jgi:hypothetical protein
MTRSMSRMMPLAVLALLLAIPAGPPDAQPRPAAVKYPDGYRTWMHLKSMAITDRSHPLFEAFGGMHHVYVNERGRAAARSGGAYPDGSVLVFDLLEGRAESGAITEGPRKLIGVMVKDARAYPETGGWGFEAFKGDSRTERLVTDAKTQCFACHQAQKPRDFTFSEYRR